MNSRNPPEGLDVARFMRRHWQREPLLLRGAFPAFSDPLTPREVMTLAGREDATARLVQRRGRRWHLEHGPIAASTFRSLPPRDWTVLVQDTNHVSREADALLQRFSFLPHARIDDVMVSYAMPGGGVGAHVDSYDVFLLQGRGRRRWQISRQRDHAFIAGLPLKVLERFVPEQEWVLEAGDMLYLPPGVAHHGVAETECLTWSIGFRAPSDAEIARGFLDALHDRLALEGHYSDAGAHPTERPGEMPAAFARHVAKTIDRIRWTRDDLDDYAGCLLSEPKAQVYYDPPSPALARNAFEKRATARGLRLDPRTRLLYGARGAYINGEKAGLAGPGLAVVRRLADERELRAPIRAPGDFWDTAHAWYRQGFLEIPTERE